MSLKFISLNGQFEFLNYFPGVGEKEDTLAVHFWGMILARENTPLLGTKHTPKVVCQCVHFWGNVLYHKTWLTKFQVPVQVLVQ